MKQHPLLSALGQTKVAAPEKLTMSGRIATSMANPLTWPGRAIGRVLAGPRQSSGPMAGRRLEKVTGPGGLVGISKEEYEAIKSGRKPGKASKARLGLGLGLESAYLKQRYAPGGLLGAIRKHPLAAAGIGGLGYLLMSRPEYRPMAHGMTIGMLPDAPRRDVDPVVAAKFQHQASHNNPWSSQAWG